MTVTPQFLHLPVEILLLIFSFLPVRDLNACLLLCWDMSSIMRDCILLRRRLQCLKHCIEDFSPNSSSTSDFLKNLEELERVSLTFGIGMPTLREPLQNFHKFTFFGDTNTSLFLRSGYLIQVRKGKDPGWSYMDLSLKRDLRGYMPALEWKGIHLEGREMHGWALDLSQDLMAVSILPNVRAGPWRFYDSISLTDLTRNANHSIKIHVMQFTQSRFSNKAVVKAVVQLDLFGSHDDSFETHIEIMGRYLVVLLAHNVTSTIRTEIIPDRPGARPKRAPKRALPEEDKEFKCQTIYLVDWGSGRVIFQRRVPKDTYFPVLASISEDTFLLARKCDWALELCEITRMHGTMGFRTRRILLLPAVPRPTSVSLKKIDETSSSTCRPSALGRPSTLPSGSRPSDSVLAFYVGVGTFLWEGARDIQTFYVLKSTLRNLAKRGTTRVRRNFQPFSSCMNFLAQSVAPHIVPWHQWGPESTRWIQVKEVPKLCAMSGTRCVISERSVGRVRMLDFSPERLLWIEDWIKHKTEAGETGAEDWSVVTSPTTIPAGKNFLCDIESKLPYYELRKVGVEGDLFIDDEWTVLIRSSERRPDIYGDF